MDVAAALADDLNTPLALAVLHERLAALNKAAGAAEKAAAAARLRAAGALLGLLRQNPADWLRPPVTATATVVLGTASVKATACAGPLPAEVIEQQIEERTTARKAKDFARADAIRAELLAAGVVLEDGGKGTTWRRA